MGRRSTLLRRFDREEAVMKRTRSGLVWVAVTTLVCLIGVASGLEEETEQADQEKVQHPGMEIFLANKCSMCHTVVLAGIGVPEEEVEAAATEAERVEPEKGDEDDGPPDLSDVGGRREAEWLRLYLSKKEAIDGRKHMKRFRGSDEETVALVEWLMTQKAPADTLAPETVEEAPDAGSAVESGKEGGE
jgi:cbb3-type cytochrome oxidase cytochrome c subunit